MDQVTAGHWRETLINHIEYLQEQLKPLNSNWVNGYLSSPGTVGAPGLLTDGSVIPDPLQIDAFSTRDDGSNTFQGHLSDISSPWKLGQAGVFTLTAYFDSPTASRLVERVCGRVGPLDTVEIVSSPMTPSEELPFT